MVLAPLYSLLSYLQLPYEVESTYEFTSPRLNGDENEREDYQESEEDAEIAQRRIGTKGETISSGAHMCVKHCRPAIFGQQIPRVEIIAGEASIVSRECSIGQAVIGPN